MLSLPWAFLIACCGMVDDAGVTIADFEGDSYAGWKIEGDAFGQKPAKGTLPNQMNVTGFQGKGLVNSYHGGDVSTGTLTSPSFEIQRPYINFLIGGGKHPGLTCINLLVGGKVVRTATGDNNTSGGSEQLLPRHWHVLEFLGKQAQLQIVDLHTGGWGHICVDHIMQSKIKQGIDGKDTVIETVNQKRELVLDKKYLLLPISNQVKASRMTITIDGKQIHNFDIQLALDDKPDWWTKLDVPEYLGKSAVIEAFGVLPSCKGLDYITPSDTLRQAEPVYNEALRPQLRFSQLHGWNNDPNGMVYHDGEYHLFWQSNPFGRKWANMYWGHAVSRDLVHWEELPYALYPRTMAKSHCFSGSAHIDAQNTGGWQTGSEKTMVAAFTDTGLGEVLAISQDRGRNWQYLKDNPIIPKRDGRDPKLIWYEPGKHWVIAVYTRLDKKNFVEFYSSTNLKQWTKTSQLEGYYECPEIFELPVDGDATKRKWVLLAADAKYAIGNFDGKTFTPDHAGKHQVHHGMFYASQCFSNVPGGRVIQVGWVKGLELPGMCFSQGFSLPIELTLKTTADGVRLLAMPVKELEAQRENAISQTNVELSPEKPLVIKTSGQLFDIIAEVEPGNAQEITLSFGSSRIVYKCKEQKLDGMPLKLDGNKLQLRIIVDRPLYEVVGGAGLVYKTAARKDAGNEIENVTLSSTGGTAKVSSVTVHLMRSIWKK
jgi:fructan beta-fructosidase